MQESKEVSTTELRDSIEALASTMEKFPTAEKVEIEVMHHFGDKTYCRTMLGKAGDMIMGKIHRKEHIVIISAGKARIVSEEFGAQEIQAPAVFKSPPGARRAFIVLEDLVLTTVHDNPTNTQDLAELEAYLITDDYTKVELCHG
jgi:hypothetical protein